MSCTFLDLCTFLVAAMKLSGHVEILSVNIFCVTAARLSTLFIRAAGVALTARCSQVGRRGSKGEVVLEVNFR